MSGRRPQTIAQVSHTRYGVDHDLNHFPSFNKDTETKKS